MLHEQSDAEHLGLTGQAPAIRVPTVEFSKRSPQIPHTAAIRDQLSKDIYPMAMLGRYSCMCNGSFRRLRHSIPY